MTIERLLQMAVADDGTPEPAPARLKSRLYSALVGELARTGPLRPLGACRDAGGRLCVFEQAVAALGDDVGSNNPCRVCHARVLAERMTRAPIFWPGCPYAEFHKT